MRLLILGGTIFLGRYLVEAALAGGHTVTLFNRGKHNPDWFPEVEKLIGDRTDDLSALQGRTWDAVIDTCGYVPRVVTASAQFLAGSVGHYTFISSVSAYANFRQRHMGEDGPVAVMADETVEEVTGETYGPLKALCEQAAEAAFPGRTLNIRPGLIVGPYDPSDRFTYWPVRVARGGEVLCPPGDDATQIIDVRDLAEWNIRLVEAGTVGVFNATGPDYRLTMREVLGTCRSVSGSDAAFTWVGKEFLKEQEIRGWVELPCWVPEEGDEAGFNSIDSSRAVAAGLTYRPFAEIARDTLAWFQSRPTDAPLRAGLTLEREQEALAAWHRRTA